MLKRKNMDLIERNLRPDSERILLIDGERQGGKIMCLPIDVVII